MGLRRRFGTSILAAVLTACQGANPYADAGFAHRTAEGFRNNHTDSVPGSARDLVRWRWNAWRMDLPPAPKQPTPVVAADLAGIRANAVAGQAMQPAATWIGHATALVQAGGLNVLTDPMFSERASPVQWMGPQRTQPPGVALADLPAIDVVLISHNHYDHLDAASVQALNARAAGHTLFLVPLGLKAWFADLDITNVEELDWWQSREVRGVSFNLTPVQHWSARGIGDRLQTLWGGWAVFAPDFHWYFSGDSGYSKDFSDTRARFQARQAQGGGFDLALIAVGAYEPTWFMQGQHVNPAQAVQVHRDLGAKRSMGVHWGTFNLTDEALDRPPADLARARQAARLPESDFFVLAIGETRRFDRRPAP
ncbi:MBL fold metallo-hydrolase [Rhodoferax koreense]|uniref:MBL fold metallo-hydrolase n=1 Tax=Rhodoferax koreensis TaxID=1842727 RepID=A0A1P8JR68_9BURK|nr:MBL fold metallo-hydrolase [Rhodoferax koreense]APW36252.1 MBL fold metallo-hydrolase [Rhodoferax koreense]